MERIDKGFSSLVSCYALLATLACSFLIYAHWAFTAHPPQWADQVGSFVTRSSSGHAAQLAKVLSDVRVAALYFLDRIHTTRLYFGVFAAVWLACLLWMLLGRRSRLAFRRGAMWIGGISLLVCSAAFLYGLGTRGLLPHQFPMLPRVSDGVAAGFLLALPLITWLRARRRGDDEYFDNVSANRLARLNLGSNLSVVPRLDEAAPLEIRTGAGAGDAAAPAQISQPVDHAMVAANRLIARAAAPVVPEPLPPIEAVAAVLSGEPASALVSVPSLEVEAASVEASTVVPVTSLALMVVEPVASMHQDLVEAHIAEPVAAVLPEAAAITPSEPLAASFAVPYAIDAEPPLAELPMVETPMQMGISASDLALPGISEQAAVVLLEPIPEQAASTTAAAPAATTAVHTLDDEVTESFPAATLTFAAVESAESIPALPSQPFDQALQAAALELPEPNPAIAFESAEAEASEPVDLRVNEPAASMVMESAAVEPASAVVAEAAVVMAATESSVEPAGLQATEPTVPVIAVQTAAEAFPVAVPEAAMAMAAAHAASMHPANQPAAPQVPQPIPAMPPDPYHAATPPKPPSRPARPVSDAERPDAPNGTDGFRHDLLGLYRSWQKIETMQGEIDEWFEHRRRQAVAHVATPPAMRTSGLGRNLVRDFPNEKMNAIESEWSEIRNLAHEISRSVGEMPEPGQTN